jgi:SHS2 domain-containing protein
MEKRYEQIEHTADLAARIYAEDLPGLFENAAFAMFDMIGKVPKNIPGKQNCPVEVDGVDREDLIVNWLNELLYLFERRRLLFDEFLIKELDGGHIRGEARGYNIDKDNIVVDREIKAATFHDVKIKDTAKGYEVTVVFDI